MTEVTPTCSESGYEAGIAWLISLRRKVAAKTVRFFEEEVCESVLSAA